MVNQILQVIHVDDDIQGTHLGKTEFFRINTCITDSFPSWNTIRFPCSIDRKLEMFKMNKTQSQLTVVPSVIVNDTSRFIQLVVEAPNEPQVSD